MARTLLSLLSAILLWANLPGQSDYNLQLLSNPFNSCGSGFNDVWGFEHSNGKEYAILGTRCGTAIYDLTNPVAPALVIDVAGAVGTWRDMKNRGNKVYIVADQGTFGIQVIDLSNPGNIKTWKYRPAASPGDTLRKAHNLYIDAMGFLYLAGSNFNNGGVVIFDLNQNDSIPPIVGYGPNYYAHDVYVNEARSLMVTSDIYQGVFTLSYLNRITTPIEIDILATQETNSHFTHNAWTTDDGNVVFTTDEKTKARVASYDISNTDEIIYLGDYTPYNTLKSNVIPHNVHVKDHYLIISHYSEGVKIVDAARPGNLVEIGSYDTHAATSGFSGCWGAFPFFTSDIVLGSDMSHGLFVLQPDYDVQVGYLEEV
ncbi:MAG: choice-of-anchor B family protein [Saprospiraceae bacterium]|nr:choice-of-anchor B family protein [Saprospiraceae bacterium]